MGSNFYYKDSLTSFEESVKDFTTDLVNDPNCRNRIIDHPKIIEMLNNKELTHSQLNEVIRLAFKKIYEIQSQAFVFNG